MIVRNGWSLIALPPPSDRACPARLSPTLGAPGRLGTHYRTPAVYRGKLAGHEPGQSLIGLARRPRWLTSAGDVDVRATRRPAAVRGMDIGIAADGKIVTMYTIVEPAP